MSGSHGTSDRTACLRVVARRVPPDAVARALSLLCSDDASVINGATIAIDGGISAGLLHADYIELASADLLPSGL